MKTRLHLLSMPMHDPLQPSTQLGYLHGHVKRSFGDDLDVLSYSAHTQILFNLEGEGMADYFATHRLFGEEVFFLVCCHDFPRLFERVYPRYLAFPLPEVHLSRQAISALNSVMRSYLQARVLPSLKPDALNIVGMTTTFAQVFASIFAAKYIREHSEAPVLFVFGGASMALPEANRVLHLWGVEGLFVTGSGEAPLENILRCCLDLGDDHAGDVIESVMERNLVNANAIGSPDKPIDLSLSRSYMASIGDPNYDEFFVNLGSLCASDDVYRQVLKLTTLPLEGSRGCFARCDFCQNPNITTQFRTLTGHQVANRSRRLVAKYGVPRLYFADSVCNSWAEDYADDLMETHDSFPAFMEMRVHAPESFFTKLALAGVREMQLGIEAISAPLLRAIMKGTKVIQNLRAAKYLAELGIDSSSNLITHHPKSTLADIEESKRVIRLVTHFPEFCMSRFVISYASPIYNELTPAELAQLTRGFVWLPDDLQDYSMVRDLAYPYPSEWLKPEVDAGWSEFRRWYAELRKSANGSRPELAVEREADSLMILDTRFGEPRRHHLSGQLAQIFELCHAGPSLKELVRRSGLSHRTCEALLGELTEHCLTITVDDCYLSLALRPRTELIDNLARQHDANCARRAPALTVLDQRA